MADDEESRFRVHEVGPAPPAYNDRPAEVHERGARHHHQHRQRDEAKNHFNELAKAAELAHEALVREHSPYRFCVYREGDAVFIDIVTLDGQGAIASVVKKDISHDEFMTWIEHMEEAQGLFLDDLI